MPDLADGESTEVQGSAKKPYVLNNTGGVMFGMKVESIMDRVGEDISLDLLSRLIVDAHGDSAKIADALMSEYQRSILEAKCRPNF